MSTNVHQLFQEPETQIDRFRSWWRKQDKHTRDAIREIVTDDHKPATKEQAEEVLVFLNLKTGKHFRPVPANLDLIRQRLRTSTVEDCKAVIANRCRAWEGTEMAYCLRPATLFNATKFEQYMGELENDGS